MQRSLAGKYEIGEWLMDQIHAGLDSQTGEPVAIRIVDKATFEAQQQKQLMRELEVLQYLWELHPEYFAKVKEVVANDQHLFIISEFMGKDLLSFLFTKGRIVEREVRVLFRQICTAIHLCHKHGITHHGLSLDRIWVHIDPAKGLMVKVSGFDRCCRQQKEGELLNRFEDCSIQYSPPEVFKGRAYNGQSLDTYALGVVLYSLLVGDLPFDDEDLDLQIEQKFSKNYLSSLPFPEDVSAQARDLVFNLLRPNPNKRISLEDVLQHGFFFEFIVPTAKAQEELIVPSSPASPSLMVERFGSSSEEDILRLFEPCAASDLNDAIMGGLPTVGFDEFK